MKKSLLLLLFACFLFAGSQSTFAQSKLEQQKLTVKNADDSAKKEALKVINLLEREAKLDDTQKNNIYEIFVGVSKKKKNILGISDSAEQKAKLTKLQEYTNEQLQKTLTSEQFALYTKKMKAY